MHAMDDYVAHAAFARKKCVCVCVCMDAVLLLLALRQSKVPTKL